MSVYVAMYHTLQPLNTCTSTNRLHGEFPCGRQLPMHVSLAIIMLFFPHWQWQNSPHTPNTYIATGR